MPVCRMNKRILPIQYSGQGDMESLRGNNRQYCNLKVTPNRRLESIQEWSDFMKTSSTWNFRSIVGKIMMGLVLAAMIGSIDVAPALGKDGKYMTRAVTRTEAVAMTAATMCMSEAGVFIGLMATGNEFMSRRRSSMHRLHRRASVSFSPHLYSSLRGLRGLLRIGCPAFKPS